MYLIFRADQRLVVSGELVQAFQIIWQVMGKYVDLNLNSAFHIPSAVWKFWTNQVLNWCENGFDKYGLDFFNLSCSR